jgi:hypothetical protein
VIEKDEGPDHSLRRGGQDAVDLEAADVPAPSFNEPFDHRLAWLPFEDQAAAGIRAFRNP